MGWAERLGIGRPKAQGNGVYERDGKWWMDPSRIRLPGGRLGRLFRQHPMPRVELGPFDSVDLADAVASYVFARWVQLGVVPSTEESIAAVTSPEGA